MDNKITIVTGLWDIKRDQLGDGWSRSFDHYKEKLDSLLDIPYNLIIYGEEEIRELVFSKRTEENTQFVVRTQDWFKNDLYDKIQVIRNNDDWKNQVGWLAESTQSKLDMYNPLVMSKVFLMHDAKIMDKFGSTHLYWLDAGITSTVHSGYFTSDRVLDNLIDVFKISFVAFPYEASKEIHGFEYNRLCELAGDKVDKVCRGGFFGGPVDLLSEFNGLYYNLMDSTLNEGYMGTEESLFTILLYNHPEYFQYYEIEGNGLLATFFENLKNNRHDAKVQNSVGIRVNTHNKNNVALYVLTYNSPNQFEKLCISFEEYDRNFLDKPKKYLINNSLDESTFEDYDKLCEKYGFEEIHKENIGICGGRQFISEHADENDFDYHFFFEDDMFFYLGKDEFCKSGFRRRIDDFYNIMLDIAWNENFDFLKWNYTEFFGDNGKQWAWHNVPADVRAKLFPERPLKINSNHALAPDAKYKNIKSHKGVPYANGEIYYCNWPQVVSKEGNKKMFLDIKWANPFEQTWMSYIFQETLKGNIYPGLLLATPTEHDRFEHYDREERREN